MLSSCLFPSEPLHQRLMTMLKLIGQHFAIGAQLALMAIISLGLATNTQEISTTTVPSLEAKVAVVKPSPQDLIAAKKAAIMDKAVPALSPKDAALYRVVFKAQKEGNWNRAENLIEKIEDRRLIGSVLADRFERLGATLDEQKAWLKTFPTLPEAQTIYDAALERGDKDLPAPLFSNTWSSGGSVDSATSFISDYVIGKNKKLKKDRDLARNIRKKAARGRPTQALKILQKAKKKKVLPASFTASAEATIAASFFRVGKKQEATALAYSAARAGQPLGLWIAGLITWETKNYTSARVFFARLAKDKKLTGSNRAAAHFWAYRAYNTTGRLAQANFHLQKAAAYKQSLYGLLASQLLNKNPISSLAQNNKHPHKWGTKHHKVLTKDPAGWRALALIQIGQNERAEAELRRINPRGKSKKRRAMQALANFAHMPALALRLAHLQSKQGYGPTFYPLLPWEPKNGFKIDRALLFALARQESLFNPQAISSRGARGLLQIMPATANEMIERSRMKVGHNQPEALFDPTFNITLGQKYVRQLTKIPYIGNNLLLLLAAYNGGPGKTLGWITAKKTSDPLLFMESIPVRETRQYIARVLPHYWAYRARLGKSLPSLHQMAQGLWPIGSLAENAPVRVAVVTGN
ncbi:MAG TPA: hypothetical protein DD400_04040 [Rhodospirillaceae bacterium]|nr:hypothetical protein [Rhodospirillaceae bacterium]